MSYVISTRYREQLLSEQFNAKIKMMVGRNCKIDGFNISCNDNVLRMTNGTCIIEGACIEAKYKEGFKEIPLDRNAESPILWYCLQYNHVAGMVKEVISTVDPTAQYCLVLAKLVKVSDGFTVEALNQGHSLAGIFDILKDAQLSIDKMEKAIDDIIENQNGANPSTVEVVEARDGEKTLKARLDRDKDAAESNYNNVTNIVSDLFNTTEDMKLDMITSDGKIETNKTNLEILQNTVDNIIEVPQLVSPKEFPILEEEWVLNKETNIYCARLTHNLNLAKEAVQAKFYDGLENAYCSYSYVNNNVLDIYYDTALNLTVILGQFTEGNLYTKPEIDEKTGAIDASITALENQVEQLVGAPTLTRPKIYDISTSQWELVNGLYEYTLVHNLGLSKENVQIKFYSGDTNILLEYEFVNTNSIKILNTTPEVVTIVLGEFVSVDFYTRPEVQKLLEDFIKKDGSVRIDPRKDGHGGILIKTQDNSEWMLGGSGAGSLRLIPFGIGGEIERDRGLSFNSKTFYSETSNEYSLSGPSSVWKEAWVGGVNKNGNGYCKLTNGLIIQWGQLRNTGNGWTNYPLTFPNKCFSVIGSPQSSESGVAPLGFCTDSYTTESFQYRRASSTHGYWVNWWAIGY